MGLIWLKLLFQQGFILLETIQENTECQEVKECAPLLVFPELCLVTEGGTVIKSILL